MRAMPIVLVDPRFQMIITLPRVLVEAGVGPFANGGLNKTFGFAVGPRGVDAGTDVSELKLEAGEFKAIGDKAGAVVGHDATQGDVKTSEVSGGLEEKAAGGNGLFIGHHGDLGETGVVIDSDVEELPAGAASFVLGVAGEAVAGLVDAGQFLDIDVDQIAGRGILVAEDGDFGQYTKIY
jgi:hypothetical protein